MSPAVYFFFTPVQLYRPSLCINQTLTFFDFPYKLIRSGIPFYGHCLLQRFKMDGFVCPEVKFMIYFSKIYPSNTDNCVLSDKQPYMVFFLFFPLKVLF